MPRLIKERETVKIKLPTCSKRAGEDVWVECYTEMNTDDIAELARNKEDKGDSLKVTALRLIHDWNFEDANGNKEPINLQNLGYIPSKDLELILSAADDPDKAERLTEGKKKKS